MMVPLPAAALDLLLTLSMAASIIVFLSAVQIRRAVELSVFPTLLLLLTLFRLSLSIASSRRILLHGQEGTAAAWKVIEGCSGEPYVFGIATGKRFQRFGKEKPALDKLCGVAGWRIHDLNARLFREWHDWAFPRTSPIRFSTIKPERFLVWRPQNGTIF